MAVEQKFTALPTTATAQMSDIICAVQGFVNPTNLGLSVQETLQQVYNLFQSNLILFNAGDPNGLVAGTTYQFCWDTVGLDLYICTTSGTAATAVWTKIADANNMTVTALTGTNNQVLVDGTVGIPQTGALTLTLPQDIASTSSPTFSDITLTNGNVIDANGNIVANFFADSPNDVNYLLIHANQATSPPGLSAVGADTDIGIFFATKGDNGIGINTEAIISPPLTIYNGSGGQHQTNFLFANTANSRNVTFQDSSGTVAYLTDIPTFIPPTPWVPVFTFATPGDLSVLYTIQSGIYSKIGNMVLATFILHCTPTYTTASGILQIDGLPIVSNSTPSTTFTGSVAFSGNYNIGADTWVVSFITPATNTIKFSSNLNNSVTTVLNTATFTSGSPVIINATICYMD